MGLQDFLAVALFARGPCIGGFGEHLTEAGRWVEEGARGRRQVRQVDGRELGVKSDIQDFAPMLTMSTVAGVPLTTAVTWPLNLGWWRR